jgi:hypothetical protein
MARHKTENTNPETENRKQATENGQQATAQLRSATDPLRARYGDKRINGFLRAVQLANPCAETINQLTRDVNELLKLEPSEQMITDVTNIVDKLYESGLDKIIAELSISRIAIGMMRRNEEFVVSLMNTFKELSAISPLLFMGALGDQPYKELLYFSDEGLHEWVDEGKRRFSTDTGANIAEFFRYVTMCGSYADVAQYKISESAVFLDDAQQALTIFAQQKFNRRLVAMKSRSHVPHVQEQDEISIYLPDHVDHHEEKARNERTYFMTTLHEGSHIERGTFILDIQNMTSFFKERGLTIKKIEFRGQNDKRIKTLIVDKEGKEYLATSMFHLVPLLARERDAKYINILNNILEDIRMDSGWLREKAPGYMADCRQNTLDFLIEHRKLPDKLSAVGFIEGLCQLGALLPTSQDMAGFLRALEERVVPDNDDSGCIEHLLSMDQKVLELILQFKDYLIELSENRDNHSTDCFIKTFKIYEQIKHLLENEETNDIGKGEKLEGISGPLSLSDLDPEKVELSFDPEGIDLDDLPEDVQEKLKEKLWEAFPDMSKEDLEKLAKEAGDHLVQREDEEDKPKIQSEQQEISGRWDIELVNGVEVKDYCDITTIRLGECQFLGDEIVALNIRNTARRLMSRKLIESPGALYGEIDPLEKREWKRMRRRGMIIPRNYHIEELEVYSRSISILIIGDASGSTDNMLNGKRKIDYISGSVHSLASGLANIQGLSTSYGFFNSWGRNDIKLFMGKDFNDPLRFAAVEPGSANRDGAIIRKAGAMLSRVRTEAKLALFVLDSMPADSGEYAGKYGVEDVRHALTELKKSGIQFFVITVPPDENYYRGEFSSQEEYLSYLYLARSNYALIESEKELDSAFSACVRGILPNLRRRRRT